MLIQRILCNLLFAVGMLLIMATINGIDNHNLKGIFTVHGNIIPKMTTRILSTPEPIDDKPSYQLDSSLSNFVDTNEKIVLHIHPNLNATLNGKSIVIPSSIGINGTLWNDHSWDQFGMQPMKMTTKDTSMIMQGMAPLHTHDTSGVIHVESNEFKNYTLGQFLQIWGVDLDGKEVKLSINGSNLKDYESHVLADKEQMILNIED